MICSACGKSAADSQRYCAFCGAELRALARVEPQPAPQNWLTPAPNQEVILIGRDPSLRSTVHCFLDHPAVSLQHARIERRDDQWFAVDLNSSKGTFVNYQRVTPGPVGQPLGPDDTLWIAPYAFRLRTEGARSELQPAHMRLDAVDLRRQVKVGHETQTILDLRQTPLAFVPGEFIALVGGSGCGKSTLMKALNGQAPAQEGQVLIDSRPIIEGTNTQPFAALHSIVGYVPQDDVMHRDLTVTELLTFVARLRLADLTTNEIADAVDKTLEAVDLSQHARKLVRFLSGGQRKRVNIAMELLARPRLLFLDEPTSGLDPGLDLEVMTLLRGWARGESVTPASQPGDPKTIVLVTHATENIELCDYIAFMERGGQLAYFGPPQEAKRFFFPEREPGQITFAEIYLRVATGPAPVAATADSWAEVYQQSPYFERYIAGRSRQATSAALALLDVMPVERRLLPTRPQVVAGLRQFGILAGRYARLIGRDKMNAAFLLLQAPLVALLLAAVSTPQALRPAGALDAEKVLFILACAAVWLGIVNSTKVIVAEQDIYQRERLYGLGAVPYVFSKIAVLGIIGLIQMALLVFFIGLVVLLPDRGLIAPIQMEYFITLALTVIAGQALGLLISALAGTTDLANTLMFLLLIVQVIFSGLLFDPSGLAEIPAALTISRWSLQALGSSTDLNRLLLGVMPGYDWNAAYGADIFHLLGCWAALLLYAAGCVGLACWRQGRK
jgi:ABC-type multidrug transport system ATPase subunit